MFRTVFPSIISSSTLYMQQQAFVKQILLTANKQSAVFVWQLYVQSWTADDGRKDRPKHVECYSKINKFDTLAHLVGFTIEIFKSLWESSSILVTSASFLKGNLYFAFQTSYYKIQFYIAVDQFLLNLCWTLEIRLPNTTTHSVLDTKWGISRILRCVIPVVLVQ